MKNRAVHLALLVVFAALMFLASGLHGSYFCVSPWVGERPLQGSATNANP
jgi:hypothetical protein